MKNVNGQLLTKGHHIDKRALRGGKPAPRENSGQPYMRYELENHVNDVNKPWYVVGFDLNNHEKRTVIGRYSNKPRASAELERLAMRQPNRKTSPKLAHKLLTKRYVDV